MGHWLVLRSGQIRTISDPSNWWSGDPFNLWTW